MKPSRENIFLLLARLEQSGSLPESGPISVFSTELVGLIRTHATQFALRIDGDNVFVRMSRLPFARPLVFSRQALKAAKLDKAP